ncbi:Pyridoxamine 5'-phosphate oxidase [Anatilimnocola aggregata]|uniref:Pyridoxamine 5'-phosphate oxidase n=1 Tax=Anatilimnocola aggregata TaxID=2528021 RepID=A0A517YD87_9BACT|nr:pyridoxamine 5'-phosphate oxidase family protein [Anatilimnocola aggregata]QDU28197.1 Pyridoxamine 5'-phosphate oxidase [Anatilimnocola aggregata]
MTASTQKSVHNNNATGHETHGDIDRLAELISDIRVAMLTTFPSGGKPHARPMYTQEIEAEDFDGTLWFMTDAESLKIAELAANPAVLITYAAPSKNRYVVVTGTAHSEHNPEKAHELWNIHAKGWYPNGPDDPSLALIRVQVASAEYWDGPSNTSYLLNLLTAVVTGTRVSTTGKHGTLG